MTRSPKNDAEPTGHDAVAPAVALRVGPLRVLWLPKDAQVVASEPLGAPAGALDATEVAHRDALTHPARRLEFDRSRWLARAALGWRGALPRDDDGVTRWPDGVIASLSHTQGHVAFARGDAGSFAGIGVDAEALTRVKAELAPKIIAAAESAVLERAGVHSPGEGLALTFALKEALFKCVFPVGRRRFWFLDAALKSVEVEAVGDGGRAELELLVDASARTPRGAVVQGHYRWRSEGAERYVVAVALLPASAGVQPAT
jgi:4'-phosphopantetheinyl transferase EntD